MTQPNNIPIDTSSPNNSEIVLYQSDSDIRLEVRLEKDTVWLTQQQMSQLFQKDRTVITRHINNIFSEGELDEKSNVQNMHFPFSDKPTKMYNLDVIISVGYRVKSQRGTQFRRWANSILKDYLLRGYAVNQQLLAMQRQIDSRFEQSDNRMLAIESALADHQNKIDFFVKTNLPPIEQVFFNGQFFEARVLLEKLVKSAQKRVVIIDAYIDAATFEILDVRQDNVAADIYSGSLHTNLCNAHNSTTNANPICEHIWTNPSHDRWLIIDDDLFHCGHSIKDMGKKLSAILRLETAPDTILNAII